MKPQIVDLFLVFAAVMSITSVGNAASAKFHGHRKIVYVSFSDKRAAPTKPTAEQQKEIQALENLTARHSGLQKFQPVQYVVGADEMTSAE